MELSDRHKRMIREHKAIQVLSELRGIPGRTGAIKAYQKQVARQRNDIVKQNQALNKWTNKTFFGA